MALSANTAWEVMTTGDALNGGGFNTGGTDFSQQTTAQLAPTDLATSGAGVTTLTSATGGFTEAMVGNVIQIASGTNFDVGFYEITARTDTNTVTLDHTPTAAGAGSGGVGKVGGALISFDALDGVAVAANRIWVKNTATYTIAAEITLSASFAQVRVSGYGSTRGDGTKATIQAASWTGDSLVRQDGISLWFENLIFDAAAETVTYCYRQSAQNLVMHNCHFLANGAYGFRTDQWQLNSILDFCYAEGATTAGFDASGNSAAGMTRCVAKNCAIGFNSNNGSFGYRYECITINGIKGFVITNSGALISCIMYSPSENGIIASMFATSRLHIVDCLISNAGGYAIKAGSANALSMLLIVNTADYNSTSGRLETPSSNHFEDINPITLSADPFVNAAGEDFNLADTGLRAKNYSLPGITSTEHYPFRQWVETAFGSIIAFIFGGDNF